jgi:anti-anti-sigma regulatory factor
VLNSVPLDVRFDEATSTWHVAGDVEDAAPLTHELDRRLTETVVVDLSGVTFLPSQAVGALALRMREARALGGDIRFTADPGTMAHRLLTVMALLYRD